jgi:hypothetical protein
MVSGRYRVAEPDTIGFMLLRELLREASEESRMED